MSLSDYLAVGVGAIGVLSATLIGLAHAGDPGRKWLRSTTIRLITGGFYLFLIAGTGLVVWSFGARPGAPTRGEILLLLLWIFNGSGGIAFAVTDLLRWRRTHAKPTA